MTNRRLRTIRKDVLRTARAAGELDGIEPGEEPEDVTKMLALRVQARYESAMRLALPSSPDPGGYFGARKGASVRGKLPRRCAYWRPGGKNQSIGTGHARTARDRQMLNLRPIAGDPSTASLAVGAFFRRIFHSAGST